MRALFTSPDYERWVLDEAERTQRERARAAHGAADSHRLEEDVRAAEHRAENVMESIATLGSNDLLARKFRDEEKKLLDARQRLAAWSAPRQLAPVRLVF